jgi:hypothetical protein
MPDIRVNGEQWRSLSEQQQAQITKIMKDTGLLQEDEFIEPDPGASPVNISAFPIPNPGKKICQISCDVAQTAAVAACSTIPGGAIAIALCVAAAQIAGDECRDRC